MLRASQTFNQNRFSVWMKVWCRITAATEQSNTSIKLGYEIWVAATRLGYVIKFFPYQGAGTTDTELGLGSSVVSILTQDLSKLQHGSYHVIFDNLFTSPRLLRLLAD
jgi:hypothetical protein